MVWTGTECYNIMIEYWGREPRQNIPFPSRVECLLWSSNCSPENPLCSWIIWAAEVETEFFLWRPKLLKSEEEEEEEGGETNKKVWKWYKLNRRANIYICVCVCVWQKKSNQGLQAGNGSFSFPFCPNLYNVDDDDMYSSVWKDLHISRVRTGCTATQPQYEM